MADILGRLASLRQEGNQQRRQLSLATLRTAQENADAAKRAKQQEALIRLRDALEQSSPVYQLNLTKLRHDVDSYQTPADKQAEWDRQHKVLFGNQLTLQNNAIENRSEKEKYPSVALAQLVAKGLVPEATATLNSLAKGSMAFNEQDQPAVDRALASIDSAATRVALRPFDSPENDPNYSRYQPVDLSQIQVHPVVQGIRNALATNQISQQQAEDSLHSWAQNAGLDQDTYDRYFNYLSGGGQ
jgi:hypothetical protein